MSHVRKRENHDAGWLPLALAAGAAGGVVVLLGLIVGAIWLTGASGTSGPATGAPAAPTPTPRSLAFLLETQVPESSPGELNQGAALPPNETPPAVATAPALLSTGGDGPPATVGDTAYFSAPGDSPFTALSSGSWQASGDTLYNLGVSADAEPMLTIAAVPGTSFAIEAEIKVNGVLDAFCSQSFGIAGGDSARGHLYGGSIYYPCSGTSDQARLTEVTSWQDGYHDDPLIAENAFSAGESWRTYRFEIRGAELRFIIDGVGIVSGSLEAPLDAAAENAAAIWSQGVDLEIRSIEVLPLPDD